MGTLLAPLSRYFRALFVLGPARCQSWDPATSQRECLTRFKKTKGQRAFVIAKCFMCVIYSFFIAAEIFDMLS